MTMKNNELFQKAQSARYLALELAHNANESHSEERCQWQMS